jgi:hypothetical protein
MIMLAAAKGGIQSGLVANNGKVDFLARIVFSNTSAFPEFVTAAQLGERDGRTLGCADGAYASSRVFQPGVPELGPGQQRE